MVANGIFVVDLLGPGLYINGEGGGGLVNSANPGVYGAIVIGALGGGQTGGVVFCDECRLLIWGEFWGCSGKKRGGHG